MEDMGFLCFSSLCKSGFPSVGTRKNERNENVCGAAANGTGPRRSNK